MYHNYSINEEQFLRIGEMLKEASEKITKDAPWHQEYKYLKWDDKYSHFSMFGDLNLDTEEVETITCALLALRDIMILSKWDGSGYNIYLDRKNGPSMRKLGECSQTSVLKVVSKYY